MKKIILMAAMLFSMAISANDFNGLWESKDTTHYKVILLNNNEYHFINFSFAEQNEIQELVLEVTENYIKTKIHNPNNGWTVFVEYNIVDENTILAKFTGDINADTLYELREIK